LHERALLVKRVVLVLVSVRVPLPVERIVGKKPTDSRGITIKLDLQEVGLGADCDVVDAEEGEGGVVEHQQRDAHAVH
jgi:hypothetical protein